MHPPRRRRSVLAGIAATMTLPAGGCLKDLTERPPEIVAVTVGNYGRERRACTVELTRPGGDVLYRREDTIRGIGDDGVPDGIEFKPNLPVQPLELVVSVEDRPTERASTDPYRGVAALEFDVTIDPPYRNEPSVVIAVVTDLD